ncbi:collagen alpha-2(I) chain-like isoform X2 [Procambarus clarkii]
MRCSIPILVASIFYVAGVTSQYQPLQTLGVPKSSSTSPGFDGIPRDTSQPLPGLIEAIGSLPSSAQPIAAEDAFILQGPGSGLLPDAGQHRGSFADGRYFPQDFHSGVAPGPDVGQGVFGGPGPNVGQGVFGGPGPNVGQGVFGGPGPNVGQGVFGGPGPNVGQGVFGGPGPNVGQGVFGGPGPNVGQGVFGGPATIFSGGRLDQVSVPRVAVGSTGPSGSIVRPVGVPQVRRVDDVFHPTVTQVVTVDRCVTVTDQAFNSVAVTLTSFSVQTVTVGTRSVLHTPVDDRVALQTSVFVRPTSVTLTEVKSDFRIVTETSLSYVTLAHTSYIISQYTYTTPATQVLTYTATVVHTNINTKSTTFTNYRTVTDTVYINSGYGYRPQ